MRLLNLVSFSLRLKSFLLVKEIVTKDICKAIEYETEKKKQFEHRRTVDMEKNSTRFIIRRIAKHECKLVWFQIQRSFTFVSISCPNTIDCSSLVT